MKLKLLLGLIIGMFIISSAGSAYAQSYSFRLDQELVDVFWNEDGTTSITYRFVFSNEAFGAPIDYIDVGLPNSNFEESSIEATVDGVPIFNISSSDYQGEGDAGVALGLGSQAIQPGTTGTVEVTIGTIRDVAYPDSEDENYVSAVFSPTWFGSQFVNGTTDLQVTYHLPPGVQPEEPRWHAAPPGFPSEPLAELDENERITYTWRNPTASGSTQYKFGASFPASYIPESAVVQTSWLDTLSGALGALFAGLAPFSCFILFFAFIAGIIVSAERGSRRRKLQYFPPKVSIEGHGIKRGLTAVEAAILMDQPLDKIFTMMLFSCIKKNAAVVKTRDPLEINVTNVKAEDLQEYERQFLEAFLPENKQGRKNMLQKTILDLVDSTAKKMKGFSRSETVAYYQDIVKRAWQQVEAADTPEVKSEKYDELLEWTMLDKDYDGRTREVFRTGPVFVPVWWHHYDPTFPSARPAPAIPTGGAGNVSLPTLPGSDFAASVVNGVQNFSGKVVGNITSFTEGITQKTNPPPVATTSSRTGSSGRSGSGCACACACACAGCACACAGGGR